LRLCALARNIFLTHQRPNEESDYPRAQNHPEWIRSKPDQRKHRRQHLVGTPDYIAPEVLSGEPFTHAADIFSFGVTIHELFTGIRPAAALTTRLKGKPSVPIPILANYLASELFFLLKWWLDYGMTYSPERMDQIYHDLITPTLRSQLKYFEMGTAPRQTADPSNYVRLRR